MKSPTVKAGSERRLSRVTRCGQVAIAWAMLASTVVVAQEPIAARELLNRHVLESLANAVQPSAIAANPMRDQHVWSRRAIMDALDRQALAKAQPPVYQQPAEPPRSNLSEHHASAAPVLLPSPAQLRPLATAVAVQAIMPVTSEPEPTVKLPVARDLPSLSPLRSGAVPVSAQQSLPMEPRPLQPAANAPAQLVPPVVTEPLRSVDANRGVEQTSWNRPAELPTQRQTNATPSANPLRAVPSVAGQNAEPIQRVNPLRN